jgi:diguanylate cyclase
MMTTPTPAMSMRGRLKLVSWTFFGTLGCLAVSLTFNWLAFRHQPPDALRLGLLSATVLPIVLAGPLFFYLTMKLRELSIANHRLNDLASSDSLTGCLNRRAFTSLVERQLEAGEGETPGGALIVVDADRFKAINDRYGHDKGDEALRLIAQAIRSALRKDDAVGRLGGEEFGVYLPHAGRADAAEVAERIRASVADARFAPSGRPHDLSVSVGCVVFDGPKGFRELFTLADERLYAAKRQGRNRVELATVPAIAPSISDMLATG